MTLRTIPGHFPCVPRLMLRPRSSTSTLTSTTSSTSPFNPSNAIMDMNLTTLPCAIFSPLMASHFDFPAHTPLPKMAPILYRMYTSPSSINADQVLGWSSKQRHLSLEPQALQTTWASDPLPAPLRPSTQIRPPSDIWLPMLSQHRCNLSP